MYNNLTQPNKLYNPYGVNGYLNPFAQPQNIYNPPIQQSMQQPPQQQSGFNVIPVANADEARAVQTPFDGSILILPNINNGKIYTKQLNMNTGSAIFNEYSINTSNTPVTQTPQTTTAVATPVYATQKDLDDLRVELMEQLNNLNDMKQLTQMTSSDKPSFANGNKSNRKEQNNDKI